MSVQVKPLSVPTVSTSKTLVFNLEYCSHKDRTKSPSNDTNGSNSSITWPNTGVKPKRRNSGMAARMKLSCTAFKN